MAIQPDTKDWTWVLGRPCPECGMDTKDIVAHNVSAMLLVSAGDWQSALRCADVAVRPDQHTWSALEYGCHVRDVCHVFDLRVQQMQTQDDPLFENWDQDATAIAQRYESADPATVATELAAAAQSLAARFDSIPHGQWSRTGRRTDGAEFTLATLARYFIHDVRHHLHDIGFRSN